MRMFSSTVAGGNPGGTGTFVSGFGTAIAAATGAGSDRVGVSGTFVAEVAWGATLAGAVWELILVAGESAFGVAGVRVG